MTGPRTLAYGRCHGTGPASVRRGSGAVTDRSDNAQAGSTTDATIETVIGRDLERPESVLATVSGDVFCSGGAHGVVRICPDGRQFRLAPHTAVGGMPVLANGIALRHDGSFLVANIADAGGLLELDPDGLRLFHPLSDGATSPPVNFVTIDAMGRTWVTVSSTFSPRSLAYRPDVKNRPRFVAFREWLFEEAGAGP